VVPGKGGNCAGDTALQLLTKRVAVVLQPSYLPWLGYFAQLKQSDVFVIYDDVQFDKNGWRNRNRIKTAQGAQWLTVPVLTTGQQRPTNRDVAIDNKQAWRKKHLAALRQNYARAPYFAQTMTTFEALYAQNWHRLLDLNVACFDAVNRLLGLQREIRFASELDVEGQGAERLVGICSKLDADRFFEGAAGRDYIDDTLFTDAGIAIEYQDYQHPVYPQLHGDFIPFLSVVDLLFNCGPKSLEILAR
jgi:WbqC-like protein family